MRKCQSLRRQRGNYTAFDMRTTPPTMIANYISVASLQLCTVKAHVGKIPKMYFDTFGNLIGEHGEVIFEGPNMATLHGITKEGKPFQTKAQVTIGTPISAYLDVSIRHPTGIL